MRRPLLFLALLVVWRHSLVAGCQSGCSCQPAAENRRPRAWCRGLRRMPSLLDPQTEFLTVEGNVSSVRRTDSAFYLNLAELDISRNLISSIAPDAFEPLGRSLRRLHLRGNRLKTLPDRVFSPLSSLLELDLSNNEGLLLTEYTFTGLDSLERLDLSRCGLSQLPPSMLAPLKSLKELVLEGNRLLSFPFSLADTPSLEQANLRGNLIGTLDPLATFHGDGALLSLDLAENLVSALHREHLLSLPSLTFLNLSDNQLDSLPGNVWEGVSSLEVLDLSRNYFPQLHTSSFDALPALRVLDLSHSSKLRDIQANSFVGLSSLRRLSFASSPLQSLPSSAFSPPIALDFLDVSNCELTTLPSFLLDSEDLVLRGNEWDCSCSFRSAFPIHVEGVCASPETLAGTSLSSLTACSIRDHLPLLVGVLVVLLLLTILLVLLCIRPRRARSPLFPHLDASSIYEKGDLLPSSSTSNASPVYSYRTESESPYLTPNPRPFLPHHPEPPIEDAYTVIESYPVPITRL